MSSNNDTFQQQFTPLGISHESFLGRYRWPGSSVVVPTLPMSLYYKASRAMFCKAPDNWPTDRPNCKCWYIVYNWPNETNSHDDEKSTIPKITYLIFFEWQCWWQEPQGLPRLYGVPSLSSWFPLKIEMQMNHCSNKFAR